jgi:hypothetical protein
MGAVDVRQVSGKVPGQGFGQEASVILKNNGCSPGSGGEHASPSTSKSRAPSERVAAAVLRANHAPCDEEMAGSAALDAAARARLGGLQTSVTARRRRSCAERPKLGVVGLPHSEVPVTSPTWVR